VSSNLDRYKKDLDSLVAKGDQLSLALEYESFPERIEKLVKEQYKEEAEAVLKTIPVFRHAYQAWYSEAKVLIKQVLPDRLAESAAIA
jgi:hypothetical protein